METNWAAEHLQVIRTLMERSALYRRALAPIMMVNGAIGIAGAVVGCALSIKKNLAFSAYWMGISLLALIASFLIARRQALKEQEPFWSLPTRRVTQALLPSFLAGLVAGVVFMLVVPSSLSIGIGLLPPIWAILYGLALHSAGFFMERGIKLLGWLFVLSGLALLLDEILFPDLQTSLMGHAVMGGFFGLLQLAYSIYLYSTEKVNQAA